MKIINLIAGLLTVAVLALGGWYYTRHYARQDTTPPTIECNQTEVKCPIDATTAQLTAGLTASDDVDGDLSDQIMVNGITVTDDSVPNNSNFNISYVVFDSASNSATCERTLIYTNYHSPRFSIVTPLTFASFASANQNLQAYLTAEDCIEGDISSQIVLEYPDEYLDDNAKAGLYECSATVTNQLGDSATIPLLVNIIDTTGTTVSTVKLPEIEMSDYIVYLHKGGTFNPADYIEDIVIDKIPFTLVDKEIDEYFVTDQRTMEYFEDNGVFDYTATYGKGYYTTELGAFLPLSSLTVNNNVDMNKVGSYIVTYSILDPETEAEGTAFLIVVVE